MPHNKKQQANYINFDFVAAVECDAPSNPQFGNVEPNDYHKFRFRSYVKYTCKAHFYLWGNSTRQCLFKVQGGPYWTDDDPECVSLTAFEEKCKQRPGYHLRWSPIQSKPHCVLESK